MIIHLTKAHGDLYPATPEDAELFAKLKTGETYKFEVKQMRNAKFHRKFFAMLNVGFDAWEPPEQEYKGLSVQKNFERFRKDVVIAAGFYDVVSNLKGEIRAEAHSISFGKMTEEEFEQVYSKVADVILQRILTNYTKEDLENVVNQMMEFVR